MEFCISSDGVISIEFTQGCCYNSLDIYAYWGKEEV